MKETEEITADASVQALKRQLVRQLERQLVLSALLFCDGRASIKSLLTIARLKETAMRRILTEFRMEGVVVREGWIYTYVPAARLKRTN